VAALLPQQRGAREAQARRHDAGLKACKTYALFAMFPDQVARDLLPRPNCLYKIN
jgi:hypothetical protein